MNIFSMFEGVIQKISVLPGLGFLQSYVTEFHSRKAQLQGRAELYRGYVSTVRSAGTDVAQAARGGRQEEANDDSGIEEEEYDDEDDETFMQ